MHSGLWVVDYFGRYVLNVRGKGCMNPAPIQPSDIGWPIGNGKRLSCSQAQLGQAKFLSVGPSYVRRLYSNKMAFLAKFGIGKIVSRGDSHNIR